LFFAFGAFVPVLPFLCGDYYWNIPLSIGLTALTLFLIGMILSLYTNKHPIFSGLRMLLIGVIAGAITFWIGKLIGTSTI